MVADAFSRRSFLEGAAALALAPVLAKLPDGKPIPPPSVPPPLPTTTVQTIPGRYIGGWWWKPSAPYSTRPVRLRVYNDDTIVEEVHLPPDATWDRLTLPGVSFRATRLEATASGAFGGGFFDE